MKPLGGLPGFMEFKYKNKGGMVSGDSVYYFVVPTPSSGHAASRASLKHQIPAAGSCTCALVVLINGFCWIARQGVSHSLFIVREIAKKLSYARRVSVTHSVSLISPARHHRVASARFSVWTGHEVLER